LHSQKERPVLDSILKIPQIASPLEFFGKTAFVIEDLIEVRIIFIVSDQYGMKVF